MNYKRYGTTYRVKDTKKFALFIATLFIILIVLITTGRPDKVQIEYRPYTVSYKETYWGLARKAQEKGLNKDIRDIVDEMIEKSGIMAHDLKAGDTIWIPFVQE